MAGNLFSGILFTLYCRFNFLASLFVLSGYIPSSALTTVLLVVLQHPSIFLAAVICTVFSCFTNFAFPSHASPAYSNFDTITFIKTHLLILVSRFESVRTASILLTCALPFLINTTFAMCASQEQSLEILTGGWGGRRQGGCTANSISHYFQVVCHQAHIPTDYYGVYIPLIIEHYRTTFFFRVFLLPASGQAVVTGIVPPSVLRAFIFLAKRIQHSPTARRC